MNLHINTDQLGEYYTVWIAENNLPEGSVEELLSTVAGLSRAQVEWLKAYKVIWNDVLYREFMKDDGDE